jgi:hypothetical protein
VTDNYGHGHGRLASVMVRAPGPVTVRVAQSLAVNCDKDWKILFKRSSESRLRVVDSKPKFEANRATPPAVL